MRSFIALALSLAAHAAAATCYTLELTWQTRAPDGFKREMILINGQFPGPLLEFVQDDWVEITVVNKMPFNTTLHAHGEFHGLKDDQANAVRHRADGDSLG
jgi:FtsP/CotA-like multicopper oxidase with cupredoxin domain